MFCVTGLFVDSDADVAVWRVMRTFT